MWREWVRDEWGESIECDVREVKGVENFKEIFKGYWV